MERFLGKDDYFEEDDTLWDAEYFCQEDGDNKEEAQEYYDGENDSDARYPLNDFLILFLRRTVPCGSYPQESWLQPEE